MSLKRLIDGGKVFFSNYRAIKYMNQEKFIEVVKIAVEQASIEGVISNLEQPPGRQPSPAKIALSSWFNKLAEQDREFVGKAIEVAVKDSIFGFLCLLDGVRSIQETNEEDSEPMLKLTYIDSNEEVVLNNPNDDYLHDIYNSI